MIRTLVHLLPDQERGRVTGYVVLAVVGVVLRAAGAVILMPLVSALFGDAPEDAWPWLGVLTAVTVVGWGIDAFTVKVGYALGFSLLDHAQHAIADRLTRIRLAWLTAENTATARQAIAATGPDLVGLIAYLVTPLIGAILLPIAIGVALLPVAWPLGLAALAGVPVLLAAFWASVRISRRADRAAAESNSALTERIVEFARTQQALRAARRVEPARGRAGDALSAQYTATMRLIAMQIPGQLLFSLASQIALVLLAGTTTVLAVRSALTVPEAIALIVVIVRYLDPFTALGELSGAIESTQGVLGRIRAVLDAPVRSAGSRSTAPGDAAPTIELRGVEFRYGSDAPVLTGFDLVLDPGTTTAIVGPSGSGKSTILALIAGLHEPTEGRVLVDGFDVSELDSEARQRLASVIFQHPYLFTGTVLDNIRVGDPNAGPDRIAEATALAQVDEVTSRLPEAGRTLVGEAGTALSGGERQRVSIARALLKPAPILLVDEATSALDTENEAAIVHALTRDRHPRTRVIVAHRLTSIRAADRVVFVDDGRIIEDGTVDGLLERGGRFAEFWRQQTDSAGWRISSTRTAGARPHS